MKGNILTASERRRYTLLYRPCRLILILLGGLLLAVLFGFPLAAISPIFNALDVYGFLFLSAIVIIVLFAFLPIPTTKKLRRKIRVGTKIEIYTARHYKEYHKTGTITRTTFFQGGVPVGRTDRENYRTEHHTDSDILTVIVTSVNRRGFKITGHYEQNNDHVPGMRFLTGFAGFGETLKLSKHGLGNGKERFIKFKSLYSLSGKRIHKDGTRIVSMDILSSAGDTAEAQKVNIPSKSYKLLAWIAFGLYAFIVCAIPLLTPYRESSDIVPVFGGLLVFVGVPTCIILGIIGLVKRSKYKPKNRPKAKFNTWALLTLLVPVAGIVFAAVSLIRKGYSSLSKHLTCWVAVTWLAIILFFLFIEL